MLFKESMLVVLALYIILVVTCINYWFGVSGPFLLDDFHNLQSLGNYGGITSWEDAKRFVFGNGSGPMGRSISMATFLADDFTWPVYSIATFKITNIALHCCVGLALLLVLRRLLIQEFKLEKRAAELISLIIFAFWLLHPIHISTVLYVIQRMTILSAFFTLLAFLCYLQLRGSIENKRVYPSILNAVLCVVFFMLAIFSKENALLLIPFIYICEVFLFKSLLPNYIKRKAKTLSYLILLTSPVWLYITFDLWGKGYEVREFNLLERIVLQVSVLGDYISKIIFPVVERMNLFNERFTPLAISIYNHSFLTGVATSFLFLVIFFIAILKKQRLVIFGFSWFVCFHLIESTIIPLEIYFEHRNYLPSAGLVLAIIGAMCNLLSINFSKGLLCFLFIFTLMYLSFTTVILSKTWGDTTSLFIKLTGDEPSSIRAKVSYSSNLEARGLPEFALAEIEESIELKPDMLSLRLNKIRLICKHGLKETIADEIKDVESAYTFDSAVIFQLKRIIQLENHNCQELVNSSFIEDVFRKATQLENFEIRPKMGSQLYYLLTDYYVDKRMFSPAMEALNKAISLTPTVDLLVRKIVLLSSAGLYESALEVVPEALAADERRGYFIPSRSDEILFLKKSLINSLTITQH